jgi:hypothetical protein
MDKKFVFQGVHMMFQGLPQVKKKLKAWTKKNRLPRSSYDVPGPAPVFPVFFLFFA